MQRTAKAAADFRRSAQQLICSKQLVTDGAATLLARDLTKLTVRHTITKLLSEPHIF